MPTRHRSRARGLFSAAVAFFFTSGVYAQTDSHPNDPYLGYEDSLLQDAWEVAHDAPNVVVAVIDSGFNPRHPDLRGNLWVNGGEIPGNGIDDDGNGYVDDQYGYDFVNDRPNLVDEDGHGTLMAGIIGAKGNNNLGIAGVAWNVKLMNLKVLGKDGTGKLSAFVKAINYAIAQGAQIISAAWVFQEEGDFSSLEAVLQDAHDAGILVVTAAGNDGVNIDKKPVYPASFVMDNLIAVASLAHDGNRLSSFSNYGYDTVQIAAPGEQIIGTLGSDSYGTLTGSSPATAIVVGTAALMLSVDPTLSPAEIKGLLVQGADPSSALSSYVSAGSLNPYQSLALVQAHKDSAKTASVGSEPVANQQGTSIMAVTVPGGCSLIPD